MSKELNSEENYTNIFTIVKQEAAHFAKKGFCRDWTKAAFLALSAKKNSLPWEIYLEVREVYIVPSLSHTFLRIIIATEPEVVFIADGTGTNGFEPYFGLEDEMPSHLKNSHFDQINDSLQLLANNTNY